MTGCAAYGEVGTGEGQQSYNVQMECEAYGEAVTDGQEHMK